MNKSIVDEIVERLDFMDCSYEFDAADYTKGEGCMKSRKIDPVTGFDSMPGSALIDIDTACAIACRSRSSIYRNFKTGELTMIKVGNSTRIRVGELRRLIGVV